MSDHAPKPPASIRAALFAAEYRTAGMGEGVQALGDLYTPEGCALVRAQAVWDALLAEGRVVYQSKPYSAPLEQDWEWEPGLWIPTPLGDA